MFEEKAEKRLGSSPVAEEQLGTFSLGMKIIFHSPRTRMLLWELRTTDFAME